MDSQAQDLPQVSTSALRDDQIMRSLARDLARDLLPLDTIAERYHLTAEQVATYRSSPAFRRMYESARGEWTAVTNTKERVQLKAQLAVEEALLHLYAIVQDCNETGSARVQAFKELKEVGRFEKTPPDEASLAGTAVSVTINFANGPQKIGATVDGTAQEITDVDEE